METASVWSATNPIISVTILLLASLLVPPLTERLGLPGLVGLLLAGIGLGSYGLGLLDADTETIKLLSDVGKIYLMFAAGLEIDMAAFQKTRNRAMTFGFLTFAIPLAMGTGLGAVLGAGLNRAILLGSLLASHTLLAYPLLQRLGLVKNEAVTVTVGATIFTDIGALFVLAVCVSIQQGEFSWLSLALQLALLAGYTALALVGLKQLGKSYFRHNSHDEGSQFLFTLLALFLASVGAQMIQTENIVGAFLAGLAVSDVLGHSQVKEKVEFVGSVLFIPFFFIAIGLIIDVPTFFEVLVRHGTTVAAVVACLLVSKGLAAWGVKQIYGYPRREALLMWSLSMPQVAATLAAALVGYQVGLLSEVIFNSIVVLMLVTSTLGPLLTRYWGSRLGRPAAAPLFPENDQPPAPHLSEPLNGSVGSRFSVMVPVHNPETEPFLVAMAGRLAKQHGGQLLPLAVVQPLPSLERCDRQLAIYRQRLTKAADIGQRLGVPTTPVLRIDDDVARGICHSSREQEAHLVIMGYGDFTLPARLLGSVADQVLHQGTAATAVMRLQVAPLALERIVIPVEDLRSPVIAQVQLAQQVAQATHGQIVLVYGSVPALSPDDRAALQRQLSMMIPPAPGQLPSPPPAIAIVDQTDLVGAVLQIAQPTDLVLIHYRSLGSLKISPLDGWGGLLLQRLDCSVALVREAVVPAAAAEVEIR